MPNTNHLYLIDKKEENKKQKIKTGITLSTSILEKMKIPLLIKNLTQIPISNSYNFRYTY